MKTNDLWSAKAECCGCELCSQSCPKAIINMKQDEEGFLYPHITNEDECIGCKRCVKVCPMKAPGRDTVRIIESFSFSLGDAKDLRYSASGGFVTAVSRSFINKGGVVYGVAYSEDGQRIGYHRATTIGELEKFRGSKYAQAEKGSVYSLVREDIKECRKILYVGLPCEVSAIYHAVTRRDNLYTISLICHGPTSQKVHRDYLASLPIAYSKIDNISVRYKKNGWKPYYIHIVDNKGDVYEEQWGKSDYGIAFQYLKRPSCHTCRYKTGDNLFGLQSDITVGDFHALKKGSPQYNRWGVSQVSIQSEKGRYLVGLVDCILDDSEIPHELIMRSNRAFHMPIPQRWNRKNFVKDYQCHSLHYATHSWKIMITDGAIKICRQLKRVRNIKKLFRMLLRNRYTEKSQVIYPFSSK